MDSSESKKSNLRDLIGEEEVQGPDFFLPEKRQFEQYFYSKNTIVKLLMAFEYHTDPCCLCTPTLGDAYYRQKDKAVDTLDIDTRFSYLPKYHYYDIKFPYYLDSEVNFLVIDPPYFLITIDELYDCVLELTQGNFKTKLVIGYLRRFEREFLKKFEPFNLKPTKFPLEYQTLKPNKWKNCKLYSNYDFKGIKTIDYKQKYKKKTHQSKKDNL